jgi:hypothetical protein
VKKILITLLLMVASCAFTPGVIRDAYMERASEYDKTQYGNEYTREYQLCYAAFMAHLYRECAPLVDGDSASNSRENQSYWQCANDALDKMELCTDGLPKC